MKLNISVLCFFIINGIVNGHQNGEKMIYVDEMVVLKGISSQLNDIRHIFQQYIPSCEANQENTQEKNNSFIFDIRFDTLPEKCKSNDLPKSCAEATACTKRSGIYRILLDKYSYDPFLVECDVKTADGGWTLIQRRQDGSVDFFRNWDEYQKGFGNIDGEFFIGLDKLHALTNYNGPQELLVILQYKNDTKYAKYSNFVVGNENELYALKHLGDFSGDAGDSLIGHLGAKFTTKDRDNDRHADNCAVLYTGAWWYYECHTSNLNGKYGDTTNGKGINWYTYRGHNTSMDHVTMMVRRRNF